MTSLGLLELQLHHKTSPQKDSLVRRFHWFGEIFEFTPILGQWSILFGLLKHGCQSSNTQLHKHNGTPNCTNDLIKFSWCSFRVDLNSPNQRNDTSLAVEPETDTETIYESSDNAIKDATYRYRVCQGDWHDWSWLSNTEAQLNGMLCEFRSTSAHFRIVLLWDTFSHDDLKQTFCQGWQRQIRSEELLLHIVILEGCVSSTFMKGSRHFDNFATYHHSLILCLEKGINTKLKMLSPSGKNFHQRQAWHQERRQRPQKTIGI